MKQTLVVTSVNALQRASAISTGRFSEFEMRSYCVNALQRASAISTLDVPDWLCERLPKADFGHLC